jgi:uncharacterized protein YbdZ (MbtH family)
MANPFEDTATAFVVLVNDEDQYSVWPAFREPPEGWAVVGPTGDRQLCLEWIEAHWIDMRPKSLRTAAPEAWRTARFHASSNAHLLNCWDDRNFGKVDLLDR